MEQKTDHSFGVVPVYKEAGDWRVLLIQQIGRKGDTFWTFPKGHPEANELPTESALRELQEETGITDVFLHDDMQFTTGYMFVHDGVQIDKKVNYYLGFVHSPDTHITQPREVADLQWCSFADAAQKLTHQNMRELLTQVTTYIDERS